MDRAAGPKIAPRPLPHPSALLSNTRPTFRSDLNRNEKRKKITSACQLCQRRKVRCDGNQPCATCIKVESPCTYARELDGRVGVFKRKFHEVQDDQTLLNQLLEIIRDAEDERVFQVVSLIRRQVPLEKVKAYITEQLVELQLPGCEPSPDLQRLRTRSDQLQSEHQGEEGRQSISRSGLLQITRLIDQPLHRVRAKPWTSVTDDDELVSHLISSWLAWDACMFDWLNARRFVRDMRQGSETTSFCSPFLVNCVLAWACPFGDYKETRSSNGEISPLVGQFVTEAQRLLEHEISQEPSLPTVQGLIFLAIIFTISGDFHLRQQYVLLAVSLLQRLTSSHQDIQKNSGSEVADQVLQATSRAEWALFIITTHMSIGLRKPQVMKPPKPLRLSHSVLQPCSQDWSPSFIETHDRAPYCDELFDLECGIAVQAAEISRIFFDCHNFVPRKIQEKRGLHIYHIAVFKLMQCPTHLSPTVGSDQAVIVFHARTLGCLLRTLMELRKPVEDASSEVVQFAATRCVDTAVEVVRVLRIYSYSCGSSRTQPGFALSLGLSLTIFLETVNPLLYLSEISDICDMIRALMRRWPIYRDVLKSSQHDAEQKGIVLPPSLKAIMASNSGPTLNSSRPEQPCGLDSYVPVEMPVPSLMYAPERCHVWADLMTGQTDTVAGSQTKKRSRCLHLPENELLNP